MTKKRVLLIAAIAVLVVGAVVLANVLEKATMEPAASEAQVAPDQSAASGAGFAEDGALPAGDIKEAAAQLVGESMTREEIEAALGECDSFNMNSAGCERGVYAGEFYYDGFMLYSRTYDKGKTYRIMSVNE